VGSHPSWKKFEAIVAGWIGGKRYPANSGYSIDAEGPLFVAQCKEVKTMSLAEITRLVEVAHVQGEKRGKLGMVGVKLRAGQGRPTTALAVLPGQTLAALLSTIEILRTEAAALRAQLSEELSPAEEPATTSAAGGNECAPGRATPRAGTSAEDLGAAGVPPGPPASGIRRIRRTR